MFTLIGFAIMMILDVLLGWFYPQLLWIFFINYYISIYNHF
jgi:hypothetical protein